MINNYAAEGFDCEDCWCAAEQLLLEYLSGLEHLCQVHHMLTPTSHKVTNFSPARLSETAACFFQHWPLAVPA